jgi:REP element-mobilizing transposase RayT
MAGGGRGRGARSATGRARTCARVRFPASVPVHVTLKVIGGLPSFRREAVARVVRAAIAAGGHRGDFRVVHFSVLGDHLHFVVEAAGAEALARGMQGLTIRLARRLNALLGRRGKLFAQRYHARPLRTPTEVRNAIRYVLLNARHHGAARGAVMARGWVDPYSSALWFDGWKAAVRATRRGCGRWRRRGTPDGGAADVAAEGGLAVAAAGRIGVDEVPGRARSRRVS